MNKTNTTRRDFLKASAAAGAVPYFMSSPKAFANNAANDRPQIACIGVNVRGINNGIEHADYADIVAICDVDSQHAERSKHDERIVRGKCDTYKDYRKVLDRDDIDAVSISTPEHWHIKIAVEALEAGKHVFCEKPLTLTLEENQLIRNACKKHQDKIFFIGTQQRSMKDLFLRAVNMVQKGLLGGIKKITVGIGGAPMGGPFAKSEPPKELDWDLWLGQAPKVDYIKERCHFEFRWWHEYSGGKFTDWGAHHVDIATWATQHDKEGMGPIEFDGTDSQLPVPFKDGYPTVDNCYNTANDYAVNCKFTNGMEMVITSRGDNGILFEGTKGRIFVNRVRITGKPIEENWDEGKFVDEDVTRLYKGKQYEDHKGNFYRCIREGGLPVSDVFSHVQAMNTCHLAALAARLGRVIKWDPKSEQILGDDLAAAFFARKPRKGYEILKV